MMLDAFEQWQFAGLKHYGSLPTDPENRVKMAVVWANVLLSSKVYPATIKTAMISIRNMEKDFPTAARLVAECERIYSEHYRMIGREVLDERGEKCLITTIVRRDASESECAKALAARFRALEPHGVKALPAPEKPSVSAVERLRSLFGIRPPTEE